VSGATGGGAGNGHSAAPAVSLTGRFIAFDSMASNFNPTDSGLFRDVFLFDFTTGDNTRISQDPDKTEGNDDSLSPSISPDEKIIAFASNATNLIPGDVDANRQRDIFLMPNPATTTP